VQLYILFIFAIVPYWTYSFNTKDKLLFSYFVSSFYGNAANNYSEREEDDFMMTSDISNPNSNQLTTVMKIVCEIL